MEAKKPAGFLSQMMMHLKNAAKGSKSKSKAAKGPPATSDEHILPKARSTGAAEAPAQQAPAPAAAPAPPAQAPSAYIAAASTPGPLASMPVAAAASAALPAAPAAPFPMMKKSSTLILDDLEARMAGIEAAFACRNDSSPAVGAAPAASTGAVLHAQLSGPLSSSSDHHSNTGARQGSAGGPKSPESMPSSHKQRLAHLPPNSNSTRRSEGSSGSSALQPVGTGAQQSLGRTASGAPSPPLSVAGLQNTQRLAQQMMSGSGGETGQLMSAPSSTGAHLPLPAKRSTPTPAELLRNVEASSGGKKLSKALDVILGAKRDASASASGSGSGNPLDNLPLMQPSGQRPTATSSIALGSTTYDHAAAIVESLEASMALMGPGAALGLPSDSPRFRKQTSMRASTSSTVARHSSCMSLANAAAAANAAESPSQGQGLNQLLRTLEQTTGGRKLNRALDELIAAKHSDRQAPPP